MYTLILKYKIHTNDTLTFNIRNFTTMLPHNHEIYNQFSHSFQNATVSYLIQVLNNCGICNDGINVPAAAVSFVEHSVLIVFALSFTEAIKSPSFSSNFY